MNKFDLKIGNYVNYEQTTHQISELHSDKCIHFWLKASEPDMYETGYDEVRPIEISEQELLKFGFDHFKRGISLSSFELTDYWEKTYGEVNEMGMKPAFIIWTDRKITQFTLKNVIKPTEKKHQYVHELQQMYLLLTGEQLFYENK